MKFIKGEKIYLGPIEFDKIKDDYYNWINSEENRIGLASGYFPKSIENLKEFINSNNNINSIIFGIYDMDNSSYIGNVKIGPINWKDRVAEFGRFIGNSDYRGKGIGTEVTKLVLKHCFDSLNLNKVTSGCLSNNFASKKSNEKNGMKLEGRLVNHVFENGKYYDVLRFGILKKDYENQS